MNVSFKNLGPTDHAAIQARLEVRKSRYLQLLEAPAGTTIATDFLLIGDKPGPSAPADPGYHHTPFYSTKHCSGWLNAYLHVEGIPEEKLLWINAYDRLGNPFSAQIAGRARADAVIALGHLAAKWARTVGLDKHPRFIQVPHPQWHKRFMHGETYDLIETIKCCLLRSENRLEKCAFDVCPMHSGAQTKSESVITLMP
jgi:hypothetical protein